MLKTIKILRERVENCEAYPFSVPAIRSLDELKLRSRVCLFAGENGTGKSTLLEAIAAHYGFGREGGNRSFGNDSTESNHSIDPLVRALRLSFDRRTGAGYFLRAESFFNTASYIDQIGVSEFYGGSLHSRSHGETFFALLQRRFRRNGFFLLDEPEAALSPQRQLSFLVLIHFVLQKYKDAQFIISTHSPIILGYPEAQIFSFDDGTVHEVEYEATTSLQVVRQGMHLEDTDLIFHELKPGVFNCEIRVESKPDYKYQTKTGSSRNVGVSRELMDRLLRRKATKRSSKLLFGTSLDQPDYHLWDRVYLFRPAYIQPLHGIRTKTRWYGAAYALMRPLYPLWKMLFPNYVTTTECVGRAMLNVTKRGFPKPVVENRDINRMCPKES